MSKGDVRKLWHQALKLRRRGIPSPKSGRGVFVARTIGDRRFEAVRKGMITAEANRRRNIPITLAKVNLP